MKEINSKNIPLTIRKLLSLATSDKNVNEMYGVYMSSINRKIYGFEVEGIIVGCIGIESRSLNECEIKHIAVFSDRRGKGIGSKMIEYVSDKYPSIFAETDKDAVVFYQKYGFEITSLGEKYPGVERFLCVYKR